MFVSTPLLMRDQVMFGAGPVCSTVQMKEGCSSVFLMTVTGGEVLAFPANDIRMHERSTCMFEKKSLEYVCRNFSATPADMK